MKKGIIIILLILSCFGITSCSNDETEYESGVYKVNNNVGESYSVEYKEKAGFPDHQVEIIIRNDNRLIVDYTTQYKKEFLPNEIIYLFDDDENMYFYVASDSGASIIMTGNKKNNDYKYTDYDFSLNIDFTDTSKKYVSDYLILAERLREKMNEEDIIDDFSKCNYQSDKIITLYNLK